MADSIDVESRQSVPSVSDTSEFPQSSEHDANRAGESVVHDLEGSSIAGRT